MNILVEHEGRRYLAEDASVESPNLEGLGEFACLLWEHGPILTRPAERGAIAGRVLDAGCRYVVCGGLSCDEWEESFDEAFVERTYLLPDAEMVRRHVMTTSHVGEPLDDVAFFFVKLTAFDDFVPRNLVVLHVGGGSGRGEVDASVCANVTGAANHGR